MYLMSAHRTLIGIDVSGNLIQLTASDDNLSKFFRFENLRDGDVINEGPLANFTVEISTAGISFLRNGKYLCAPADLAPLVVDREWRMQWELFSLIPDDEISTFLSGKIGKTIYDIGSNNGDDIPYYLMKGDKVVAVEANPLLARQIEARFEKQIKSGALIVENCVVTIDEPGQVFFYLHKGEDFLSQLPEPDPENMVNFEKVELPAKNIIDMIRKHGPPYYIKIDVEHYDQKLLKCLFINDIRPPYLSCESHHIDVFCLLVALGNYDAFKLVEGWSVDKKFANHEVRGPDNEIVNYSFPYHSAGPMGNDIAGKWMNKDNFFAFLSHVKLGWKDIHVSRVDLPDHSYLGF